MLSRLEVPDQVRKLVEEEEERRIRDGWERGTSLMQIISEAFLTWIESGDADRFKDEKIDAVLDMIDSEVS